MLEQLFLVKGLSGKESSSSYFKREEIRGLFLLGLLAVLASIRIQNDKMIVSIGQASFDIIPLLDITIVLWSFYAFFMILGLSEDVLGEAISSAFRESSKVFLGLDFMVLGVLAFFLSYFAFPSRLPWALILLSILPFYFLIKRLSKLRKESPKFSLTNTIRANIRPSLIFVFFICIIFIFFGSEEQYIVPSFLVGFVSIIIYIIMREKASFASENKEKEKNQEPTSHTEENATSLRDLDDSFNVIYVVLSLISGFLFVYENSGQQELTFKFYFGLNLIPIIILGLIWWGATFFNRIALKMFGWFFLFNLLFQSLLLVLAALFPNMPFYLFPFTPLFATPLGYLAYKRYNSIGHVTVSQKAATIWLCSIYSIIQFFWYVFLILWLLIEFFRTIL